jgi:hypothetical protein
LTEVPYGRGGVKGAIVKVVGQFGCIP